LRTWRTVRRLSPRQVAHRLRLRTRARLRLAAPGLARTVAALGAGDPPPPRDVPEPPADLLRPAPPERAREAAERAARGRFRFLGESRDLGDRPFPAPADVSLLWAYHLEYMEWLYDLARERRWADVARLAAARTAAEGRAHPAASHPYVDSRRAASWLRAIAAGGDDAPDVLVPGAWIWANRVAANLEHDVGGNHLLENGLCLALAGAAFRGPRAARLAATGARILRAGAAEQVLADGAHYEQSPMYHARVLQVLVEGGRATGERDGAYWETCARMAGWLRDAIDPEGELPLLGDCARSADLDPRRLVAAAAARIPGALPAPRRGDRFQEGSGLVVLEDPEAGNRLLLDAGPVCPERLPAHGQADTFAFELHAGGVAFLVDAGLYGYAAGRMRDWCRSTRAHGTVEVGGEDSSEIYSSFRVGRRARVRAAALSAAGGLGTFSAEHDGYRRLGAIHRRLVSHLAAGLWLVADRVTSRVERTVRSRLHLHPDVVVERRPGGGSLLHRGGRTLAVVPFGDLRVRWEDGWHCPRFGRRRESRLLCLESFGRDTVSGVLLSTTDPDSLRVGRDGGTVRAARGGRSFTRALP